MERMQRYRAYSTAAALVAVIGGAGGFAYGRSLGIPDPQLIPMLAAFVVETVLYLACGFNDARRAIPKWALAASAPLSYLIYTLPLDLASLPTVGILLVLGAAVVWWFDVVPKRVAPDLLLMVLLAAVYIGRVFPALYPDLHPKIPMSTLGHLMWVRLALITLLNHNGNAGINFSFVPTAQEWRLGLFHFLGFIPAGFAVMAGLGYGTFDLARGWWYKALLGFVGSMLLVAASEEILFRGVFQQRFMKWWGQWPGLLAASILFGLAHLPYRHFPNWNHVALTFVLALFLGRAYIKGQGVRAPMVAHSLVVAAGRALGF